MRNQITYALGIISFVALCEFSPLAHAKLVDDHKDQTAIRVTQFFKNKLGEDQSQWDSSRKLIRALKMKYKDRLNIDSLLMRYKITKETPFGSALDQLYQAWQNHNLDLTLKNAKKIKSKHKDFQDPLKKFHLAFANLRGLTLKGTELPEANLIGANLSKADFQNVNISNSKLEGCILRKSIIMWSNLENTDMTGIDAEEASFYETNLTNALLIGANMRDTELTGANLSEADLEDADLSLANADDANFTDADLTNANLSQTNLAIAKFKGATLDKVIWNGANFTGAVFNEK